MSLSDAQLIQLEHDMDKNHRELVVMPMSEFARNVQRPDSMQVSMQAPQVCARTQGRLLDGVFSSGRTLYGSTVNPLVNTNWGVPTAMAAWDARNIATLLRDIGGIGTRARISVHNGREYLILSGYPGLRQRLKGTRYAIANPQIVDVGSGDMG